ncbi:MAG: prefoldin subunit alpha [Candidatus Nitrosopelagicus sp.]|jgi:prefoldin alpha subunit|nr:prefoldin subunit alpha [Candidatus Nitrosopelagicus sp.]
MSEEQTQQLLYQMQMLENMFGELTQKENSIINIIREANSAIHSIKGIGTESESDSLVPLGLGVFMKSKVNSNEKIIINVGSGVAIEKNHNDAINYLESRLKELEIALQDTNQQRQQVAANLEQGKQQMQNLMQKSQNPTK